MSALAAILAISHSLSSHHAHIPITILTCTLPLLINSFERASYISANFDVSVKDQSSCIYSDREVYYAGGGNCSRESTDQAESLKAARNAVLILFYLCQVHICLLAGRTYIVDYASV